MLPEDPLCHEHKFFVLGHFDLRLDIQIDHEVFRAIVLQVDHMTVLFCQAGDPRKLLDCLRLGDDSVYGDDGEEIEEGG